MGNILPSAGTAAPASIAHHRKSRRWQYGTDSRTRHWLEAAIGQTLGAEFGLWRLRG